MFSEEYKKNNENIDKIDGAIDNEEIEVVPDPIDAYADIVLRNRDMEAVLTIDAPEHGGKDVDLDMIKKVIKDNGIQKDIDFDLINRIINEKLYGQEFIIAQGKVPVDGKDGHIKYLINTEKKLKPKELENDTVDFKDLGIVQNVSKGQTLVEKTPPTPSIDGYTVKGSILHAVNGKDPALPNGKNTEITSDGLSLIAQTDGHVDYIHGRVCIYDVFTVNTDVSNETGNIKFNGSVVVNGNVMHGFIIEARGNITIKGLCDAATIISDGSITIGEGMNGGKIVAGDDIKCKFFQTCYATAGKDIFVGTSINSDINCGGTVTVSSERGTIMGGSCTAGDSIRSNFIGSPSGNRVVTRLEIGTNFEAKNKLEDATKDLKLTIKTLADLDKIYIYLGQLKDVNRLDDDKAQKYETVKNTIKAQTDHKNFLEDEIESLKLKLEKSGTGAITVKKGISEGTKITIGPFNTTIADTIGGATILKGKEGIEILSRF